MMLVVRSSALSREDAVLPATECQQAACHPDRAGQQRSEGWGERVKAGERHQPRQAGEDQDEEAPAQLQGALQQGQRCHRAQHRQEPAQDHLRLGGGLGLLSVPLRGQQPLQRHEVPRVAAHGKRQQPPAGRAAAVLSAPAAGQVAGEEKEGTGDAEEGAEAAGQAQQGVQRPGAAPAAPVLLAPGAAPAVKGQEREDKGGQGAQAEQSPGGGGGGGGREQQQREEALRGVLPQGGRAALHVAVPQALRVAAAAAAAEERQGGSRPAAVRLLAVLRGFAGSVVGGGRGGGGGGFSLFPHGGRGRGKGGGRGRGAGRASSGPAASPSSPQEKGAGLSRRFSSAGSGVRSMVGKDGKREKR